MFKVGGEKGLKFKGNGKIVVLPSSFILRSRSTSSVDRNKAGGFRFIYYLKLPAQLPSLN